MENRSGQCNKGDGPISVIFAICSMNKLNKFFLSLKLSDHQIAGSLILSGFQNIMAPMVRRYDIPQNSDDSPLTNREKLELCLKLFDQECPTEGAGVDLLFQRCFPDGGKCRCGNSKVERDSGSRSFECNNCGFVTWFTAGTMFHQVKKLRPRLLYDTLLENGVSISASQFSRIVGIDTKTAREIFGKFTTVIESDMNAQVVSVPSSLFAETFLRRSFVTPAGEHPAHEQKAMEEAKGKLHSAAEPYSFSEPDQAPQLDPIEAALNRAAKPAGTLAESMRKVYSILLYEKALHFDYLCNQTDLKPGELSACLTLLEIEALINRQPGDWYQRNGMLRAALGQDNQYENSEKIESAVASSIVFIRRTFDGIARKYLQKYLAYWSYIIRAGEHTELLIDKCLRFGAITQGMTRSYVTPLIVRLAA